MRSMGDRLVINHDPFEPGDWFDDWLKDYSHRILVVNTKEEGLESRILDLLGQFEIEEFFFLDQSFPFLVQTVMTGEARCAVRVSEYESVETALSLAGKVSWVWVDTFTRFPLSRLDAQHLREAGYQLCLVSPELHGHEPVAGISEISTLMDGLGIAVDAVCTKRPDLWES